MCCCNSLSGKTRGSMQPQVIGIAVGGDSDRRRCWAEPGHQHVEAGETFVARLTTRIGGARECSAVRSDTKAEAFWK